MKRHLLALAIALLVTSGCSVARKTAMNQVAKALAGSGDTFSRDDDPQLIREAVPFGLKLHESILSEAPRNRELLVATARGFTQYAFGFVQQDAEELDDRDVEGARAQFARARRLYLRARDYALRAIEVKHQGFEERLRADPVMAVRGLRSRQDAAYLYWTAAPWGAAIAISKDDPDLIADQLIVEALIDRALQLDATLEHGAIHGFLISYESARQGAPGNAASRSREHYEEAVTLSGGKLASPFVSFAEAVSLETQNRAEFESMLRRALAIDSNARPEWRLENLIMQRRARWLLGKIDRLFLQ